MQISSLINIERGVTALIGGGGATLTEEARQILAAYDRYCEKLRAYGDKLLKEEFAFYKHMKKNDPSD